MNRKGTVSTQTRNNWLIDAVLFIGALVASVSGIYFLFLPVGGYQGGRNPMYGVKVLFERSTWDDLHTWGGIVMIAAAAIHIIIHWDWIVRMTKRIVKELIGRNKNINNCGRFNAGIVAIIGMSFLVTSVSAIYLLFFPGGAHGVPDPMFLFTRTTWDLIHTWSAILLIIAAIVHFVIHWKWVTKVTGKVFSPFLHSPEGEIAGRSRKTVVE
jgi:hypothetical protein